MENLPSTPDHDEEDDHGDPEDVDHDEDDGENEDDDDEDDDHHEDDDHDPEDDDDDDGEDLGQVSLSSSSPLITLVSDTKVGRSATLASLIVVVTITKTKQTDKQTKTDRQTNKNVSSLNYFLIDYQNKKMDKNSHKSPV